MAIALRSSAVNSGASGTEMTVARPTVVAGDLLIVIINGNGGLRSTVDDNGAYAFTELYDAGYPLSASARICLYSRVAGSSEPETYAFTGASSDRWAIALLVISGANTDSPWDVGAPIQDINGAVDGTPTADSLTATQNDLAIFVALQDNNAATYSDPTNGFGGEIELTNQCGAIYFKSVAAGAVGATACTSTVSTSAWAAFLLLVKEAAAAAGNPWYYYAQQ